MAMDINTYLLAAVLSSWRQRKPGVLPPEVEFTPLNLSALRPALKRPERSSQACESQAARVGHVEAIA